MIPPLRKITSQEKRHPSKQEMSDTPAKKFFSEILDEVCEKEQQKDIHVCTNGYTKHALPYYNLISKREYCYPT